MKMSRIKLCIYSVQATKREVHPTVSAYINIPYIIIGDNHSTSRGLKNITSSAKLPNSFTVQSGIKPTTHASYSQLKASRICVTSKPCILSKGPSQK